MQFKSKFQSITVGYVENPIIMTWHLLRRWSFYQQLKILTTFCLRSSSLSHFNLLTSCCSSSFWRAWCICCCWCCTCSWTSSSSWWWDGSSKQLQGLPLSRFAVAGVSADDRLSMPVSESSVGGLGGCWWWSSWALVPPSRAGPPAWWWMLSSSMLLRDESSLSGTVIRAAILDGGVSSDGLVDGETADWCGCCSCCWLGASWEGSILSCLVGPLEELLGRRVLAGVESDDPTDFLLPTGSLFPWPLAPWAACCSCWLFLAELNAFRTVSINRAPPPPPVPLWWLWWLSDFVAVSYAKAKKS